MDNPINKISCMLPLANMESEIDAKLYLGLQALNKGFGSFVIGGQSAVCQHMFQGLSRYFCVVDGIPVAHARETYGKALLSGGALVAFAQPPFSDDLCDKNTKANDARKLGAMYCEKIFFNNAEQRDRYKSHNCFIREDAPAITGHPVFDLCQSRFEPYFKRVNSALPDKLWLLDICQDSLAEGAGATEKVVDELVALAGQLTFSEERLDCNGLQNQSCSILKKLSGLLFKSGGKSQALDSETDDFVLSEEDFHKRLTAMREVAGFAGMNLEVLSRGAQCYEVCARAI